ncbi:tRNA(Met) cytidine acetyltransferase TmcA [Avibacterium paragallinarum]|uniref:tRNA(Met) cytidine acetyltransferase TmcA n=1 Tax=Avibacterium paragallinarum TaxID=728 RepID=A0A380X526_AVIPA|nr:GNAT family N-acetyltransferase [Avibacterium paragallinarum]SUU98375.1 tRNA(Met) cytidine acetyltransferase TmcA [Avibacterium paragallinarum]
MQPRQLVILSGDNDWLHAQLSPLLFSLSAQSAVLFFDENIAPLFSLPAITPIPFFKAKNQLGSEQQWIFYDARHSFNLDTLAIAAGTLQAGGFLFLLFNHWQRLAHQIDLDSQRWSGVPEGIATPNFVQFFHQIVQKYGFPIYQQENAAQFVLPNPLINSKPQTTSHLATIDQQRILEQILTAPKAINVITAKRGRGKSALAGLLAARLPNVLITAPNKSAVQILQDFSAKPLDFITPDELAEKLQQNPELFRSRWLIIDEAAMLPLPLLRQLCQGFLHVLCTTTVQSYEGTGRGFWLKFMQKNDRTLQHFTLTEPLRWRADDLIEPFIEDLLLLNAEEHLSQPNFYSQATIDLQWQTQQTLFHQGNYQDFYGLLTLAHYKTSPVDLRRLLDGTKQRFLLAKSDHHLIGGAWLLEEGGMADASLIESIMQGVRRPKGNLVAQMLCQYGLQEAACRLKSLRISRIAIQPKWQNQGIGQGLIATLDHNLAVDFLSVSFGYAEELAYFWQKCGFELVYVGEHKEASSGCYTAIGVKGLSHAGKAFCAKLKAQFQRDIGLAFHPMAEKLASPPLDWTLNLQDRNALHYFAYYQRSLAATIPAIRRLLATVELDKMPLLSHYCQLKSPPTTGKKQWLQACRAEVKQLLQKP